MGNSLLFQEETIMVKINGKEEDAAGISVAQYLENLGCDAGRVAVEINEEILPKKEYAATILKENDSVEIVRFVGGG